MRTLVIATSFFLLALNPAAKGQAAAADHGDACAANLRVIGAALESYQRDHGSLPAHLSLLHPKHLPEVSVLHCPADTSQGQPYPAWFPPIWQLKDPGRPVSYFYLYADTPCPPLLTNLAPPEKLSAASTLRTRIERHRINFGDAVPLVQCHHHPGIIQNLRSGGGVIRTQGLFEYDASTYPAVVDRLIADARAGAGRVVENWSLPATEQYLLPVTEGPLSPEQHHRLWKLADSLGDAAADIPAIQRASAQRIAARFDLAGGRYERALARAEQAAAASEGDLGGACLVALARHRSGKSSPPLDSYLAWQIQRRHLPGVVVAVVRDGVPVYMKGHGFSNLETQTSATPETAFRIASVTKTFVATALMRLAEEGRLQLDDPVRKHLSDAPAAWDGITVRHLVTHTSGLADVWDLPAEKRPAEFTSDAIVTLLAAMPPLFAPGEQYQYNHGALLVGVLVERIAGKPFGQVLQERIWRPLEMNATRIDDARAIVPGRASNYSWDDVAATWLNARMPPENMRGLADGGMLSTTADLVKWDAALYGEKLLKQATLRQMCTPVRLSDGSVAQYGCGWQLGNVRGHRWVGHFGGGTSSASIRRFVDQKLSVIVLANLDRNDSSPIAEDIAAMLLPPAPVGADDDLLLTRRLETEIATVASGNDAAGEFYRSMGRLKSFEFVGNEPNPSGRLRWHRTKFERGTWLHCFALDRSGETTGVTLQPE